MNYIHRFTKANLKTEPSFTFTNKTSQILNFYEVFTLHLPETY